ncbi:MAG TPA: nuclear transport factor 2 family protein [Allosphingosinicella sp.]|jgi:hypothetical protein
MFMAFSLAGAQAIAAQAAERPPAQQAQVQAQAQQPPSQADLAAEARRFKLELWPRAYAESNPALLEQLLAPEFQSIDADGVVSTRAEEIAFVRSKPRDPPGRAFRYDIQRLDILPNGTAIVSGTGHVSQPLADGTVRRFTYTSSNILIRRDGRWQAVASHLSGVRRTP